MTPALQWLNANAQKLPLNTPGQFYFASGTLSAVLDNAPTYMTFLRAELGKLDKAKVEQAVLEVKRWRQSKKLEVDPSLDAEVRAALTALKQYHAGQILGDGLTREQVEVGFLLGQEKLNLFLVAISAGAVLFGACTYIGNGPNFMVKSIAEAWGVKTPTFAGYVVKYTLPVLVPVYVLVWLVFL
jgi:Na+/H+ antiporter NhaD/arsenite permease-like protein